jgi:hypothetical protein
MAVTKASDSSDQTSISIGLNPTQGLAMHHFHSPLRSLAAVALLCTAAASQAAIVSVTSRPAFEALGHSATDGFPDLVINSDLGTNSLSRAAGGYNYTVTTQSDFFVVPVAGAIALSVQDFTDTITFSGFGNAVYAFGGNFYGTNILGELRSGALTAVAFDINGLSLSTAVAGNSATAFTGFRSDVALDRVVISMTSPNTDVYVTADNAAFVPEPSSSLLVLAAGGAMLLAGARRRR